MRQSDFKHRSRTGRKRFTDLPTLAAFLANDANTGRVEPLYPIGGGGDDSSRILHLLWDGVSVQAVGHSLLDRLTPTLHGEIAAGSGTAYTLQAGHGLPASGTLRLWDVSGATEAGADVSFTVSGDALTLGASRTLAAGDYVYALQGKYVSELDLGSSGDLVPVEGVVTISSDGIVVVDGSAYWNIPNAGTDETGFPSWYIHGLFQLDATAPVIDAVAGVGIYSDATHHAVVGSNYSGAVWHKGGSYGVVAAPTLWRIAATTHDPTASDVHTYCHGSYSDGTDLHGHYNAGTAAAHGWAANSATNAAQIGSAGIAGLMMIGKPGATGSTSITVSELSLVAQ